MTGKEFKVMRVMSGIKACLIARELGISNSYLSLMENNQRTIPKTLHNKWSQILNKVK